jgi:hypothetical protein
MVETQIYHDPICHFRALRCSANNLSFCHIEDVGSSNLTGTDAVGNANAAVAIAREPELRQLLPQAFDALETFEMAHAILRHRALPFVDASKQRHGAESEDLQQVIADDGNDGVIGEIPDAFRVRSGEGAAQHSTIRRCAVRKFVVHESGGKQALSFTARN